jgi:hypothetical protein
MKLQEFATDVHEHCLRDLATEILRTAIVDARSTTESVRSSARVFLFADNCEPLLRLWCDCAGIHVDAFREHVRKLVAQDEKRDSVTSVASPSDPRPADRTSSASVRLSLSGSDGTAASRRRDVLSVVRLALEVVQRRSESRMESQHVQP